MLDLSNVGGQVMGRFSHVHCHQTGGTSSLPSHPHALSDSIIEPIEFIHVRYSRVSEAPLSTAAQLPCWCSDFLCLVTLLWE